jgi:uncharacterized protein (DUF1800 family)
MGLSISTAAPRAERCRLDRPAVSDNRVRNASLILSLVLLSAGATVSAQTTSTVDSVEYFNSRSGQYYRTDVPAEIASIDQSGSASGWARTGQSFKVWRTQADAPAGAIPLVKLTSLNFATPSAPQVCSLSKTSKLTPLSGTAANCPVQTSVTYVLPADASGNCANGTQPVFQSSSPTGTRLANQLPVYQEMFDRGWQAQGVSICVPGVSMVTDADAYRLLKQASFGATEAAMNEVKQMGVTAWVDNQLNMAVLSKMPALEFYPTQAPTTCTNDGVANSAASLCARDNYTFFQLQLKFSQNALKQADQLRQRVAFALSQILVTSGADGSIMPYGMAKYQQMFLDGAFGNYKDLLTAVTLSPVMGDYLNMANSNKPDVARGISANENFAREIMQLFSIGLYELNPDGTTKKDAQGNLIPTYSQATVENLARVFTGWTYPSFGGVAPTRNNGAYFEYPMMPVESNHDTGSKTLINGFVIPAGQTARQDLTMALDHLFSHPNVAPFISKQLIQKLVSGDPSPAYVGRVSAVFNNNGAGVRGDLKAVVRAILLDPEARGPIKTVAGAGKLKEPVLMALSVYRGLGGVNDGVWVRTQYAGMAQDLFRAPTVFNYYAPDNTVSNGKLGPEFEILTSTTAFARTNFLRNVTNVNYAVDTTVPGATGTTVDWTPWQALAGNPAALVDKLSWVFTAGAMSVSAQQQVVNAVNAIAATDTLGRARTAAYLVLSSSHFQVDR